MATCIYCQKELKGNEKFCPHCGKGLHICPKCGAVNGLEARFCQGCGAPLGDTPAPEQPAAPAPDQPAAPASVTPVPPASGLSITHVKNRLTPEAWESMKQKEELKRKVLIIGVVIVAVAFVGSALMDHFKSPSKPGIQQAQQLTKGGFFSSSKDKKAADTQDKESAQNGRQAVRKGVIHGTYVYIRTGPGKSYDTAGYYSNGEEVQILNESGSWYQVKRGNGQTGWVYGSYCREMP